MIERQKVLGAAQLVVLGILLFLWKWPRYESYLSPLALVGLAVVFFVGYRRQAVYGVGLWVYFCATYLRDVWHVGWPAVFATLLAVVLVAVQGIHDLGSLFAGKPPVARGRRIVIVAAEALVVAVFVWAVPRSPALFSMAEVLMPGVVPASAYARNLDSGDIDLTRESLSILATRSDPIAVPRAIPLLHSRDAYVWLNAALYLGACRRQEAVPYLIKGLRHAARQSYTESARDLHAITGEDFGTDFDRWRAWWTEQHPGQSFDWSSHLGPLE